MHARESKEIEGHRASVFCGSFPCLKRLPALIAGSFLTGLDRSLMESHRSGAAACFWAK